MPSNNPLLQQLSFYALSSATSASPPPIYLFMEPVKFKALEIYLQLSLNYCISLTRTNGSFLDFCQNCSLVQIDCKTERLLRCYELLGATLVSWVIKKIYWIGVVTKPLTRLNNNYIPLYIEAEI